MGVGRSNLRDQLRAQQARRDMEEQEEPAELDNGASDPSRQRKGQGQSHDRKEILPNPLQTNFLVKVSQFPATASKQDTTAKEWLRNMTTDALAYISREGQYVPD